MRIVVWVLWLVVFLLLLAFAAKNLDPVTVHFYVDHDWQAPLVLVLLGFFAVSPDGRTLYAAHVYGESLAAVDIETGKVVSGGGPGDLDFLVFRWVIQLDQKHEAVQLGLGERIRAFLLDGVLGSDGEERLGQGVRLLADGNLALLHGLELTEVAHAEIVQPHEARRAREIVDLVFRAAAEMQRPADFLGK